MKKVVLNQNSYLKYNDVLKFKEEFNMLNYNNIEFVVFPSTQYLSMFVDEEYGVGAQNFNSISEGAFCGEVPLESLKDMGILYTMLGQYQRIKLFNEEKDNIKEKLFKSLTSKFNTLLCIGEYRINKGTFYSIKREINSYLKNIDKSKLKYLSIVYEQKYIINTLDINRTKKLINKIKNYIKNKYNIKPDIYYGGIFDKGDIKELNKVFDGYVLIKESININEIKKICDKIEEA